MANAPGVWKYVIQSSSLRVRQGALDEALALVDDATQKNPDQGELHEQLGVLYHLKSQAAQTEACYRRALERNPRLLQRMPTWGDCCMKPAALMKPSP